MKDTVVFFTSHPLKPAHHGGQIRSLELMKIYEKAGFDIEHIFTTVEGDVWPDNSGNNIIFPYDSNERKKFGIVIPELFDYLSGLYASTNGKLIKLIKLILTNKNVKIFHIEQPWLVQCVVNIKNECNLQNIKIVYGSQNIEYKLKNDSIEHYKLENHSTIIDYIKQCEVEAAVNADLVLTVSQDNLEFYSPFSKNILLVQNGVGEKTTTEIDLVNYSKILPEKYFLFIGSAHKPNEDGFIGMLGNALGAIPPEYKVVIVGSIFHLFNRNQQYLRWNKINNEKVMFMHGLSESALQAVIELSSAILLPIISGDGTNLKTAEALNSNKPIIATSLSMRGFELFINDSIIIADSKVDFQNELRNFPNKLNQKYNRNTKVLKWDYILNSFYNKVKEMKNDMD